MGCWDKSHQSLGDAYGIILFFKKIQLDLFILSVFYLHVCMCTMGMHGALKGQKRVLDLLVLELQMIVSNHMDAGYRAWILCKNKCS